MSSEYCAIGRFLRFDFVPLKDASFIGLPLTPKGVCQHSEGDFGGK